MTAICTQEDTLEALIVLRHTVPGEHPEISELTAEIWHAALALYPGDVVRSVALRWNGDRFPSREEFRDAVSAEQRARREAAAARLLENPEEHPACPACDGFGWAVLSTDPFWVADACPHGCLPPLPRHRTAAGPRRRRRTSDGPQRVSPSADVIDVTDRIVGDRGEF